MRISLSLRAKLVSMVAVLFAALIGVLLAVVPSRMRALSERWVESKATGLASVMAKAIAVGLEYDDLAAVGNLLQGLEATPEVVYGVVMPPSGSVLAQWTREKDRLPNFPRNTLPKEEPIIVRAEGLLHVLAPVRSSASTGTLAMGFSLESLEQANRSSVRAAVVIATTVLVGGVIALFIIGTVLARPVRRLITVAGQIATGDLAKAADSLGGEQVVTTLAAGFSRHGQRGDEIELLQAAFAHMLVALRESTATLLDAARLLSESVSNLSGTAREQERIISAQAAALQQARVTAQHLKETSSIASERAARIQESTEMADSIFRDGEATIQETLSSFAAMHGEVAEVARAISSLAERTERIGEVTDTVKDLADQSNILALNAAIEAVRSGEHGRGFGVVAREIRNLADQSIRSTARVRELLEDLTQAAGSAAGAAEKGAGRIEGGLSRVREAGDSLRQLSDLVKGTSDSIRQISAAVSSQSAGVAELFGAVRDLTAMASDTERRIQSLTNAVEVVQSVTEKVGTVARKFKV